MTFRGLSPESCYLRPPWIGVVFPVHSKDARFDGKLNALNSRTISQQFLQCRRAHYPSELGHCLRVYCCYDWVYVGCNNAYVGGACQSNIHRNTRTQIFPVLMLRRCIKGWYGHSNCSKTHTSCPCVSP